MNKYKEAWERFSNNLYKPNEGYDIFERGDDELLIDELVEKAISKKLVKRHFEMQGYPRFSYECPNCHKFMGLDIAVLKSGHCDGCGQALDWSKEDE